MADLFDVDTCNDKDLNEYPHVSDESYYEYLAEMIESSWRRIWCEQSQSYDLCNRITGRVIAEER